MKVTSKELAEACEKLSVILHELEGKGVELTDKQDKVWGEVSEVIERYYEDA